MYVYTPAGYESSTARYPVLYLLHGAGGDEDAWDNMGRAREILDHMIAEGKAKPMIVVMTNGNGNQSAAPGITPQAEAAFGMGQPMSDEQKKAAALAGKFPDSIVADVIPFMDKNYRTVADREHRAVAGLSMGGGHALTAGLTHMEAFAYVATFSGAVMMIPGGMKMAPGAAPGPGSMQLNTEGLNEKFPDLAKTANAKLKLLYVSIGDKDFLIGANQQFMGWLDEKGVKYQKFILPNYGHEWPFWRLSLIDLAQKLF
jgi:enterochelin esterase family protein